MGKTNQGTWSVWSRGKQQQREHEKPRLRLPVAETTGQMPVSLGQEANGAHLKTSSEGRLGGSVG